MASTLLGVGSPLLDVLAQVSDDFIEKHVSGAKGGMEMISSADRAELMRILGDKVTWAPGGSAGNTVFALAKLGVPAAMLGKTGADREGAFYREKLRLLGGSDHVLFGCRDSRHHDGTASADDQSGNRQRWREQLRWEQQLFRQWREQ